MKPRVVAPAAESCSALYHARLMTERGPAARETLFEGFIRAADGSVRLERRSCKRCGLLIAVAPYSVVAAA